jgi:hypothetical protein
VWVCWVRDEKAMGKEAAKAYSPEGLAGYLSKLQQAVPTDRRVSFSRGWPRLPKGGLSRRGHIEWDKPSAVSCMVFERDRDAGLWVEAAPGEYRSAAGEVCDCFERDWLYEELDGGGGGGLQRVLGPGRL